MENNVIKKDDLEISCVDIKNTGIKLFIKNLNHNESGIDEIKLTNVKFTKDKKIYAGDWNNNILARHFRTDKEFYEFNVSIEPKKEYDEFTFTLVINREDKGRFKIDLKKNINNISEI